MWRVMAMALVVTGSLWLGSGSVEAHPTIREVREYDCIPNFTNGKDDLYLMRGDWTKVMLVRATLPGYCTGAYPQAVNNRIFYRTGMEKSINSILTNGTGAKKVAEVSTGSPSLRIISVTKDRVYYIEKRYGKLGWDDVIVSVGHDGKNKRIYPRKGVVDAVVNGNTIYYTAGFEEHLYRIGIDGKQERKLISEKVYRDFRIAPGTVYYTTPGKQNESYLIRYSLITGQRDVITRYHESERGFGVYQDWLYYAEDGKTFSKNGKSYRHMSIQRLKAGAPVAKKELHHAYIGLDPDVGYVSQTAAGLEYWYGEYCYIVPYDKTKKPYRYHYSIQ